FFLGPALAGLALTWIDVRADIAVTTALLVAAIPGALVASNTRQNSGQGLSLREPLRALFRQPAFTPVAISLLGMTLTVGAFHAWGHDGDVWHRAVRRAVRRTAGVRPDRPGLRLRGRVHGVRSGLDGACSGDGGDAERSGSPA